MTQQQHTSTNEHLQAIHAECSGFVDGEPPDLEVIIQHAEALAQQLADVQEVCRNLSEAEQEYGAELDARDMHVRRLQHALIREVNRNRQMRDYVPLTNDMITEVCRLQPGDLPPTEGSNGHEH